MAVALAVCNLSHPGMIQFMLVVVMSLLATMTILCRGWGYEGVLF